MGNTETAMKFSRLKSISSIEDNYLVAATGKETLTQVFSCAYCKFLSANLYLNLYRIYIFEILKSGNGYFWLFLYFSNLFVFGCLFTAMRRNYDLLWRRKCSLKLDYVIQWCMIVKAVKIVEIYVVKFNVSILNGLK